MPVSGCPTIAPTGPAPGRLQVVLLASGNLADRRTFARSTSCPPPGRRRAGNQWHTVVFRRWYRRERRFVLSVTATTLLQPSELPAADGWSDGRWAEIIDRIEYREIGVGLRFWEPPLWLEVTMTGPDSDLWPTAEVGDVPDQSWNWQSTDPCSEAERLVRAGATDAEILVALSEYVFENLVLNAVHEIGEWLRFDARRLFPAHGADRAIGDGIQGNGAVRVKVNFVPAADVADPDVSAPPDRAMADELSGRLSELAASWRFTYLPGRHISYDTCGPVLTDILNSSGTSRIFLGSTWSKSTQEAGSEAAFVEAVQRDVHEMLVRSEVRRISEAFTVDGRRPWQLMPGSDRGRHETTPAEEYQKPVSVCIGYDA
jgi:hypothetical protein